MKNTFRGIGSFGNYAVGGVICLNQDVQDSMTYRIKDVMRKRGLEDEEVRERENEKGRKGIGTRGAACV